MARAMLGYWVAKSRTEASRVGSAMQSRGVLAGSGGKSHRGQVLTACGLWIRVPAVLGNIQPDQLVLGPDPQQAEPPAHQRMGVCLRHFSSLARGACLSRRKRAPMCTVVQQKIVAAAASWQASRWPLDPMKQP